MRWKLIIFLSYWSIVALESQTVLYSDCGNPVAHDYCANAPSPSLCEIDGFTATTENFTAGNDPIEAYTDLFCGPHTLTHDNMWIKFVAEGSRLSFKVDINYCQGISGCIDGSGIQLAIVETDCVANFNSIACLNCDASVPLTADVIPGNTYYLMIDGCCGDICEFVINVLEGVAGTTINIDIPDESICTEDDTKTLVANMTPVDGDYSYHWFTPDGEILSDTTQPSILAKGVGEYFVEVHENITCCDETQSIVLGVDPTAPIATLSDPDTINCKNSTVFLQGSFEGVSGQSYFQGWYDADGVELIDKNVGTGGAYTYIVRHTITSCADTQSVTVIVDTIRPVALAISNDTLDCETDNDINLLGIQSTPLYGLNYQWLDGNGVLLAQNPNFVSKSLETEYTLVVEDKVNGCTDEMSISIPDERGDPIVDAGPDQTIDCNIHTVDLVANVNQGAAISNNFTYEWLDLNGYTASRDSAFTTITEDTYTLIVTNSDSGCSASDEVVITNGVSFPTITILAPTTITCRNYQVTLDASTSQGSSLGYEWSDAKDSILGHDNHLIVPDTGFYYLALQDTVSGCISRKTIKVIEDYRTPDNVTSSDGVLNCVVDSIVLEGTTSSQLNTVTNVWMNDLNQIISNNRFVTVKEPGSYYFVSTLDSTGCSATSVSVVTTNYQVPDLEILSDTDTLNCAQPSIDLFLIPNSNNLSYSWSGPSFSDTTKDINITIPGEYSVTITDTINGCSSQLSKSIFIDTITPIAVVDVPQTINCFNPSITLNAVISTPNVDFYWSSIDGHFVSDSNLLNPIIDKAGRYLLHLESQINSCENIYEIDVVEDFTLPIADAGSPFELNCNNTSYQIGVASVTNTSYQWFDGKNDSLSNSSTYWATIPDKYTLISTNDISGCTAMDEIVITQDTITPSAIINASTTVRNCSQPNFVIAAATNINNPEYTWSGPNSFSETSRVIMVSESGVYALEIKNPSNGCTNTENIEIKDDFEHPNIGVNNPDVLTCEVKEVDVSISTNDNTNYFYYEWRDKNNKLVGEDSVLTVSEPGLYSLITENTMNGCTTSSSVDVAQNIIQPVANAGDDQVMDCITYSITLNGEATSSNVNADLLYIWSFDGNVIDSNASFSASEFGVYELEIIDEDNGCGHTDYVEIKSDREDPIAMADVSNIITCRDTFAILDGSKSHTFSNINGNLKYAWYKNEILVDTNPSYEILNPGEYKLIIEDVLNHCVDSTSILVLENKKTPPLPELSPDTLTCKVQSILVDARMPSQNQLLYSWYDGNMDLIEQGNSKLTTSKFGKYNLLVTDKGNGCTNTLEVEVPVNREKPFAEASVDDELDCTTREIVLQTGNSSREHVDYFWDGPGIIPETDLINPRVNAPGEYRLVIRDIINYCSDSAEVEVFEIENDIQARAKSYDEICFNTNNGMIEIEDIEGGTPPFYYSINDSTFSDSLFFEGLAPGTYQVTIKDARGCMYYDNLEIEKWIPPTFDLGPDVTVNIGETVELSPEYSTTRVDSLKWDAPDLSGFNPTLLPTEDRTINATLVDEDGCEVQDQMRIFVELDYPIYVPNAFSPNGDGVNDIFLVFSKDNAVKNIKTMIIFDRWGNLIFENHDFLPNQPEAGWDGIFKGKPMNPGVFVYYFSVEFINGEVVEFEGDLTLLL